jgi:hypothetical protein
MVDQLHPHHRFLGVGLLVHVLIGGRERNLRKAQEVVASTDQARDMDERSDTARRRFAAECAGMAAVALLWLVCLVSGLGGPRVTQAVSNSG